MKLPISTAHGLLQAAHGQSTEICGYVLRDWSFILVPNVAEHPTRQFRFDPEVQRSIVGDSVDALVGMFHSHPSGAETLSEEDIKGFPRAPLRYWLVSGRRVIEWERSDDNSITRCDTTPAIF